MNDKPPRKRLGSFPFCLQVCVLFVLIAQADARHKVGIVRLIDDGAEFETVPLDLAPIKGPEYFEFEAEGFVPVKQLVFDENTGTCHLAASERAQADGKVVILPAAANPQIAGTTVASANSACTLGMRMRAAFAADAKALILVFSQQEYENASTADSRFEFREIHASGVSTIELPMTAVVEFKNDAEVGTGDQVFWPAVAPFARTGATFELFLREFGTFGRIYGEVLEDSVGGAMFSIILGIVNLANMILGTVRLYQFGAIRAGEEFVPPRLYKLPHYCLWLNMLAALARIPFCIDGTYMRGILTNPASNFSNTYHLLFYFASTLIIAFYWNDQLLKSKKNFGSQHLSARFKWPAVFLIFVLFVIETGRDVYWWITGPLDILMLINALLYTVLMIAIGSFFVGTGVRVMRALGLRGSRRLNRMTKLLMASGLCMFVFAISAMLLPFTRTKDLLPVNISAWFFAGLSTFASSTFQTLVFVPTERSSGASSYSGQVTAVRSATDTDGIGMEPGDSLRAKSEEQSSDSSGTGSLSALSSSSTSSEE